MTRMTSSRTRILRRKQTEAERLLWSKLRDRQLAGHKFRRQVALGTFIVDSVCFDARLTVELDGGQHSDERHILYAGARQEWLECEGFRVRRFRETKGAT